MLHRLWARWKVIARTVGNFQSRVLLSIFYFFFLAPFGVGVRLSSDPLRLRRQYRSHWQRKENRGDPSRTVRGGSSSGYPRHLLLFP
jgi:hypothetical protein